MSSLVLPTAHQVRHSLLAGSEFGPDNPAVPRLPDHQRFSVNGMGNNLQIPDQRQLGLLPFGVGEIGRDIEERKFAFGPADRNRQSLPANAEFDRFAEQLLHPWRTLVVRTPIDRKQIGVAGGKTRIDRKVIGFEIAIDPLFRVRREGQGAHGVVAREARQ